MLRFKGYLQPKFEVTWPHLLHTIHLLATAQIHSPITSCTDTERRETKAREIKRHSPFQSTPVMDTKARSAGHIKSFSATLYPHGLGDLLTIRLTGHCRSTERYPRLGPAIELVALNNCFVISTWACEVCQKQECSRYVQIVTEYIVINSCYHSITKS